MTEMGEGAQAKGCLKSHHGLLSKSPVITILMTLINLQFGARCSDGSAAVCLGGPGILEPWFGFALFYSFFSP